MDQDEIKRLLNLVEVYAKEEDEMLVQEQYLDNILDCIRIDENAHTRILMNILKYPDAFKNFVDWLKTNRNFCLSDEIDNPQITVEKHRIDGLIQEKGKYAIIIENKVCGAEEQTKQLGRYIDLCIGLGYSKEQIYILYLLGKYGCEPSEQTWGDEYKPEEFGNRYKSVSYVKDIIPWLNEFKEKINESNSQGELFKSGIVQYIDYLEHQFNPKQDTPVAVKLKGIIVSDLELDNLSEQEAIDRLKEQQRDINGLRTKTDELLCVYHIRQWSKEIQAKYSDKNVFRIEDTSALYPKVGIHCHLGGYQFVTLLEWNSSYAKPYIGFGYHQGASTGSIPQLQTLFDKNFSNKLKRGSAGLWYRWCYVESHDVIKEFEDLVRCLIDIGATLDPKPKP